jgi:hypothetical protein
MSKGASKKAPMRETLKWAALAAIVFIAHMALAMLLLTGIWLMESYVHFLYGGRVPKLFDTIPVKHLFEFLDFVIFCLFGIWGVIEANEKLRGR